MKTTASKKLFEAALRVIPGGVNSPVRAFKAVGTLPPFIARAKGAKLYDADGNAFVDYVMSWGPLVLGHAPAPVVKAIARAAARGTSYGAPTALEVTLAEMIVEAVPSMERVRLVSSGTEAVMSAIRLARAYTGRDAILKFEGCYHGHVDSLLVKAGSGAMTLGIPDSPGVPADLARHTFTAPYNDIGAVERLLEGHRGNFACVIVEPVAGNMGVVPPHPDFLGRLRDLTHHYRIVLIFDEVITGFRVAYGGAQARYGVTPDLTCLGKIIGGGLPVGAYGGRADLMKLIAPDGPVYQAGTLSGNPLAVTAGIETLKLLKKSGVYRQLEERGRQLGQGLSRAAREAGIASTLNRMGSMMTLFFTPGPVTDYASAKKSDTQAYAKFFRAMLNQGIYLAPSQFEAAFLSTAHTPADINKTLKAARAAFNKLKIN
ncbi:MAG TPA: glutamate-1-semialdehyde 2,1-aminomutase [Nitrospirales bacterium]|nr:glutamate-1-semialdehyde 2,1-aminomutase [Nitrospirales bacterium]